MRSCTIREATEFYRLAVMAIGAGTVLIQRMGTWLPGLGWGVPDLT